MRCHEPASPRRACATRDGAPQRAFGNGLRERDLAVDRNDDREVDAVPALELVVAVDRDAPEHESERGLSRSSSSSARAQSPQPAPS